MTATDPTPVLSVEEVYKSFGAEQVLEGVSLEVPEHTVTVLIGASGSGKSTLLRCINLLTSVDDGVIRLDGWDITDPEVEPDAGPAQGGHGLPVVQPLPAPDGPGQHHALPAQGAQGVQGRR